MGAQAQEGPSALPRHSSIRGGLLPNHLATGPGLPGPHAALVSPSSVLQAPRQMERGSVCWGYKLFQSRHTNSLSPKPTQPRGTWTEMWPPPSFPIWAWSVTCVQVLQQGPKGHRIDLWAETARGRSEAATPHKTPASLCPRERRTSGCLRTTVLLPFHLVSSMLAK